LRKETVSWWSKPRLGWFSGKENHDETRDAGSSPAKPNGITHKDDAAARFLCVEKITTWVVLSSM
jgi:hypothetical protein